MRSLALIFGLGALALMTATPQAQQPAAVPHTSTNEAYKRTLAGTYQSIRAGIERYVAHNPAAWTPEFENYTRIRYSWMLGADWPRLAMVQTLLLLPGLGHVPHLEAPEKTLPPLVAFLKEGV